MPGLTGIPSLKEKITVVKENKNPAIRKKSVYPKDWKWGVLFILPWLLGFLLLQLYPLIQSLYFSFTDFSILSSGSWVGMKNYIKLFTEDRYFLKSLGLTVKYAVMTVPLKLAFALFIAMILNMKLKGINLFRTIYYLPSIMGGSVAISILWKFMFMKEGIVNNFPRETGNSGGELAGNAEDGSDHDQPLNYLAVRFVHGPFPCRTEKCSAGPLRSCSS
jgi:ABC-type sugar transport system permease subunit